MMNDGQSQSNICQVPILQNRAAVGNTSGKQPVFGWNGAYRLPSLRQKNGYYRNRNNEVHREKAEGRMNVERLSGREDYEELSNEPAFSKMVKEWKAYRSTGLSPTYCKYCEEAEFALSPCDTCEDIPDTKMPTNWEWRGPQEAGKGEAK